MLKNMAKILLVGSGLTGAVTAALLREHLPERTSISMWEKARGCGGRMSTTRCPEDPSITVDLGAQYFTLTKEYKDKRLLIYEELMGNGILTPLLGNIEDCDLNQPNSMHFVTPQGSNSLVKYYIEKADVDMGYAQPVAEISFEPGSKVEVCSPAVDKPQNFDIVILTIPVPQVFNLKGSLPNWIDSLPDVKKKLQNVSYSSRYALGLFFSPKKPLNYSWCAKYISDNPCLRYIAIDQNKRGVSKFFTYNNDDQQGMSIVLHTSVPFGLAHLEEDLNSVTDEILGHVHNILPQLPKPISIKPQRWRYSQVHQAYEGKPGCVILSENPLVILAGDGFSASTFDGCWDSAEAVVQAVIDHTRGRNYDNDNLPVKE